MNPILIYPQNVAQVKFFREQAEKQGVEMERISKKLWEEIDDMLFTQKLVERSKNAKNVSRAKVMATIDRKIKELSGK
jgi:hypothetical protein